jgi:dienelactone hydrolase
VKPFGTILIIVLGAGLLPALRAPGQVTPAMSSLFIDGRQTNGVRLVHAPQWQGHSNGARLEFTTPIQLAECALPSTLDGAGELTVGGWFFPRRSGEQYFIFRGVPEIGANGERFFRRNDRFVTFVLGTDQRGFLLGTINGNGNMPFPLVTVSEVAFDAWSQLVVAKGSNGHHRFFINGTLVHTDEHAAAAGRVWPFRDIEEARTNQPVRFSMPLGGLLGEAWILKRALSDEEVRNDFEAKRKRYHPASPPAVAAVRKMNAHPRTGLWKSTPTAKTWPLQRKAILVAAQRVLGPAPARKVPLDPRVLSEEDCGSYVRRKISIQVQPDDRMPGYLLVPKNVRGRVPAVICFYGTTSGAGKETTVGLSGGKPGTPPERNRAFAVDIVEAGFVAFAPDYLRDGERIQPGRRPYDTTDFYNEFPDWSVHGKDAWDTSRAIDYLQTLRFVDDKRIGMIGHSYGGHSTVFTAALEPRIKVAVANGPVSDFMHHGLHWAVPKGGGNSQSLPAMRPYVLDRTLRAPITFYEFTALIAPRPLWVGQAAGERRPMEEENCAAVSEVYHALGAGDRVRYVWYAGDHDFPPEARRDAVAWFRRWFSVN